MQEILSPQEIRVLGCLLEKERLTPEYYPMTFNGLLAACNQKTSRDPVMELDEETAAAALEGLQARKMVSWVHQAGARVRKYRHNLTTHWKLDVAESSLLALLLLRGSQTLGELRTRSERMHPFSDLATVERTLENLIQHEDGPLAVELPKGPGQKERRFAHTLAGFPSPGGRDDESAPATAPSLPAQWEARLESLHAEMRLEVDGIRRELLELKEALECFRKQFE